MHDEENSLYRMYYRSSLTPPSFGKKRDTPRRQVTCYAESKDGLTWTRPSLGLVEFDGSKDNNIMWDGVGSHNLSVMKDASPSCPPDSLYKAVGRGKPLGNEPSPYEHGLYPLKSPDGIHWKPVGEKPVITQGKFTASPFCAIKCPILKFGFRAEFTPSRTWVRLQPAPPEGDIANLRGPKRVRA